MLYRALHGEVESSRNRSGCGMRGGAKCGTCRRTCIKNRFHVYEFFLHLPHLTNLLFTFNAPMAVSFRQYRRERSDRRGGVRLRDEYEGLRRVVLFRGGERLESEPVVLYRRRRAGGDEDREEYLDGRPDFG